MLYQDVHGVEPSIFPLEIRLGLESGRATPALAERAAHAAVTSPQDAVLATLARRSWGAVVGDDLAGGDRRRGGGDGGPPPGRPGGSGCSPGWSRRTGPRGDRKPVLAVGRDGLMLPIRGQACYREGADGDGVGLRPQGAAVGDGLPGADARAGPGDLVGAIDGLDRGGVAGLDRAAAAAGLHHRWGNHQTRYYRRVLKRMSDPHHPGRRLKWQWVIDYYHACEYITKLSEALFSDARAGASWARKMRRWLKEKPRGIYRVLHSAAALRRRRIIASAAKREQYRTAYAYLRKRMRLLDYCRLPPGSPADRQRGDGGGVQDGVHPAAEAVGDDVESGERPVDRRPAGDPLERGLERGVSILPGIEDASRNGDSRDYSEEKALKGRIIAGTGAIAPRWLACSCRCR